MMLAWLVVFGLLLQVSGKDDLLRCSTDGKPGTVCKCGQKTPDPSRIIGGQDAEVNEYPWMVLLLLFDGKINFIKINHLCGGSLVASQWVLSAAHCVIGPKAYLGIIGNHITPIDDGTFHLNLNTTKHTGPLPRKLLQFSKAFPHHAYNASNGDNDIALLKLSESLDIDIYTPICLPCKNDNFIGKKAWATGWGINDHHFFPDFSFPDVLQEVSLSVVNNSGCDEQFLDFLPDGITEAMLCAGNNEDETVCGGDSGGPLSIDYGGQHLLIGDVSFVKSYKHFDTMCDGNYSVFGNVAFFRDWIDETMNNHGGAQFCSSEPLTSTASATKEKTIKMLFFLFLSIYHLQ